MAKLATAVNQWFRGGAEGAAGRSGGDQESRVRAFANEDIYFYVKRIDNTSVVRVMDPEAGHICWKVIGSVVAAALLLICVLMPSAYGVLAGYRIQELAKETERLESVRATLEVQEAMLLSPARMEELAESQSFIDPEPSRVVYLGKGLDSELASAKPGAASSGTSGR